MPDLNRIYHVQSQERRPVLNSVNVPDAAGAFLRGAIPAAGAGMPGLKARLADADARYRERVAGNRERLSAIADLVGVGKDVADAYARASDRRLAAETDALEAAYSAHMTSGADAAYAKPRTVDKGRTTGGPAVAIREHEKAFDDTDAFRNASDKAKEAFSRRRQARAAIYFAKGDSLQAAAVQNDRKRSLELKAAADENAIRNNFGTDEASRQAFEGQLNIAIFSQLAKKRMEMGLDEADETGGARLVRDATPEESAYLMGLAKDLREKYKNDRLSAWCAKVAVDDGSEADAKGRHPLSAAIEEEINNLADEPDRVAATARLAAAERSRTANVERKDAAVQDQIERSAFDLVRQTESAAGSEDIMDVQAFADQATQAAMQIRDEGRRTKALKRIDGAVGIAEFSEWAPRFDGVMNAFKSIQTDADAAAARRDLQLLSQEIGAMRSQSGREMAQQKLVGRFAERSKAAVNAVVDNLEKGYYWDDDEQAFKRITREEALDLYQQNVVFMDGDQREKVREAFTNNRPRMQPATIDALNAFLGANNAHVLFDWNKIAESKTGDIALAPKDDWGKHGTIDINDTWTDVDVDRSLARQIWELAATWQDMQRSGAVKRDAKGVFPSLDQYLDEQLKDRPEWKNWRDEQIARRVDNAMRFLEQQRDSIFYDTFEPGAERPETPITLPPPPQKPESGRSGATKPINANEINLHL